jgi:hypothetical protein
MPQLDTSFYPGASGQSNPLGVVQGIVGIGNQLLQRQIMAGEYGMKRESFEAQKLIGQAAMESTNPDGSIDMAGFQRRIAEMPEAIQRHAWDAIEKATQRQHTIAQTRAAEIQTEQLQKQVIAKDLVGQLLPAVTDPVTGQPNIDQLIGIMASDPEIAKYGGHVLKELMEVGQIDAATASTKLATAQGRAEGLGKRLAPIAKKIQDGAYSATSEEDVPKKREALLADATGVLAYLYGTGQIDMETNVSILNELGGMELP